MNFREGLLALLSGMENYIKRSVQYLREDMPDQLWEIALENIKDGCTNPSFYNTKGIHSMLHDRFSHIPEEEF